MCYIKQFSIINIVYKQSFRRKKFEFQNSQKSYGDNKYINIHIGEAQQIRQLNRQTMANMKSI